jgi:hypothetical protein
MLPLVTLLLVAFRHKNPGTTSALPQFATVLKTKTGVYSSLHIVYTDTTPAKKANGKKMDSNHVSDEFEITDKKAFIHLRNGKTEEYDLTDSVQRQSFEKNYGKIISIAANADQIAPVSVVTNNEETVAVATAEIATTVTPVTISTSNGTAVVAATTEKSSATTVVKPAYVTESSVLIIDDQGYTGNEDVLVTITRNTTATQLEDFKKQMKVKGYELTFDQTTYNNKGLLTHISGAIKSSDGHSEFSASDFDKLILVTIKKGARTYFKVSIKDLGKRVI